MFAATQKYSDPTAADVPSPVSIAKRHNFLEQNSTVAHPIFDIIAQQHSISYKIIKKTIHAM
jgi:hypothetical protein